MKDRQAIKLIQIGFLAPEALALSCRQANEEDDTAVDFEALKIHVEGKRSS